MGGSSSYSRAVCRAPAHPVPTSPSQQPGHCLESSVLMALPLACRTQVLCPERPWLWCSTRNRCRSPAGPRAPRCYLLVEAAAGDLVPTAGPLGGPSGDPTLTSVCTSLESLGPALSPGSAQPVAQATPAALPTPARFLLCCWRRAAVPLTAGAAQPPSGLANFLSRHAEAVTWNCWVWHYFPHLTKHRVVFPLACQVPFLSVTHAHDLSSLFPCGEQRPTSCTASHRTDACLSSLFWLCPTSPRC